MVDGQIVSNMQLYSLERNLQQGFEGYCGCFSSVTLPGQSTPTTLFSFASKTDHGAKVILSCLFLLKALFKIFRSEKAFYY